jgi:hypothetical protein
MPTLKTTQHEIKTNTTGPVPAHLGAAQVLQPVPMGALRHAGQLLRMPRLIAWLIDEWPKSWMPCRSDENEEGESMKC